ncbi:MAG: macrocin O-methyltransferase [Elusimicrobia bacterium]|nr:macrocin O-methyltransferase [Elusimicrobiota bacterium]
MLWIRLGARGQTLRVYRLHWAAGKTIGRLPAWLRPAALLYRNLRTLASYFLGAWTAGRPILAGREIRKALLLGLDYVYLADVPGDIAEFGTDTGTTAAIIAARMKEYDAMAARAPRHDRRFSERRLLLWDSFRGLPAAALPADLGSPHVASGVWGEGACRGLTEAELGQVCAKFLPRDRIAIQAGWYKDTLPRLAAGTRLALLHVDCDLYESAKEILEHGFSRGWIQNGAILLFDDWNTNRAEPGFGERRAWDEAVRRFSIHYSDMGSYGWGGRKFIVHRYSSPA